MILSTVVIFLSVFLDQATKILAKANLENQTQVNIIPKVLGFAYVENKGAAFGIFQDHRWVFMLFSTFAIGIMIFLLFRIKNKHPLFTLSISMLIGGGIGNMIDRIIRGYVVDFIKFLFVKFAVFNVADCFVTVGAVLLCIYLLFVYDEKAGIGVKNTGSKIDEASVSLSDIDPKNNSKEYYTSASDADHSVDTNEESNHSE